MKKVLVTIMIITLTISAIIYFSKPTRYEIWKRINMISAGSYAYAEGYRLNHPEKDVKKAIHQLKREKPYSVPKVTIRHRGEFDLSDHETDGGDFVAYFYEPKRNLIFYVAIRGNNISTDLLLVGVNQGLDIGNWRTVNNDYSYQENEEIKTEFKNLYLTPITRILEGSGASGNRR